MPNNTYIPTKNDLKEILNLLRIREFVVSCSLDYDNNLSYSDKLILSGSTLIFGVNFMAKKARNTPFFNLKQSNYPFF